MQVPSALPTSEAADVAATPVATTAPGETVSPEIGTQATAPALADPAGTAPGNAATASVTPTAGSTSLSALLDKLPQYWAPCGLLSVSEQVSTIALCGSIVEVLHAHADAMPRLKVEQLTVDTFYTAPHPRSTFVAVLKVCHPPVLNSSLFFTQLPQISSISMCMSCTIHRRPVLHRPIPGRDSPVCFVSSPAEL